MKNISTLLFIILTINILNLNAQDNATIKDVSTPSSKISTYNSKNNTIIINKDIIGDSELSRIKKENIALKDTIRNLKDSIQNLTTLIQKVNTLYLKSVFIKIYMKDTLFLKTANIDDFDTLDLNKTTVLSKSLMLDKNLGDTLKTIKEVLTFNNNYIELFKINANVLSQKYDSINVVQAIAIIDSLKPMNTNWVLSKTKQNYRLLLGEYKIKTCDFKRDLDYEIEKIKSKNTSISTNSFLQKYPQHKFYPYFTQVLKEVYVKKSYKPEDLVCPSH
jgi:hypothetical protein